MRSAEIWYWRGYSTT